MHTRVSVVFDVEEVVEELERGSLGVHSVVANFFSVIIKESFSFLDALFCSLHIGIVKNFTSAQSSQQKKKIRHQICTNFHCLILALGFHTSKF